MIGLESCLATEGETHARATPDTQNFDTHCKHCHNKSAEKTVAESVIKVDGVLHTKNSEIPLTEFLNSHYLVLQTEQVQALVDELTRVSDELSLD